LEIHLLVSKSDAFAVVLRLLPEPSARNRGACCCKDFRSKLFGYVHACSFTHSAVFPLAIDELPTRHNTKS
jgi:hypothetical protein